MDEHERDQLAIEAGVADLVRRYGDKVAPRDVEAIVQACHGHWPGARVRDFIAVLAERCERLET